MNATPKIISLAILDQQFYGIKRRADHLHVNVEINIDRCRDQLSDRFEFLRAVQSLLIDLESMSFLTSDKPFPQSHYEIGKLLSTTSQIRKALKEINELTQPLKKSIENLQRHYLQTNTSPVGLLPGTDWEDWYDQFMSFADEIEAIYEYSSE